MTPHAKTDDLKQFCFCNFTVLVALSLFEHKTGKQHCSTVEET